MPTGPKSTSNDAAHAVRTYCIVAARRRGARRLSGGVYHALAEADLHPDWVAGISIGAINSAIIAGNPPELRVRRLREFWETVSASPFGIPNLPPLELRDELNHQLDQSGARNERSDVRRQQFLCAAAAAAAAVGPRGRRQGELLRQYAGWETLARLVDFDRINAGPMRFSVGAVEVRSGNFVYFDTTTHTIRIEHVIASGSLPPGFPATKVDGEFYWDGGLISNTPLQWVLESRPRQDTLAFQVDLWNARGELPQDMIEVEVRHKEIVYSSRNRAATDQYQHSQRLRIALAHLISQLPPGLRDSDDVKLLSEVANDKVCNIVHLIYRAKKYEGIAKDFEFSRRTMEEHWSAGYHNARRSLANPEVLQLPDRQQGVRTFDIGAD